MADLEEQPRLNLSAERPNAHSEYNASDETISLSDQKASTKDKQKPGPRQQKRLLQRAVLRWLIEDQGVTAVARDVPTRVSRYSADVAAFRSKSFRNNREGPSRLLSPQRTLIIQCYTHREQCWPDCTSSEQLLHELRSLKQQQSELEYRIRQEEPELRNDNSLFEEYAEWNYAQTRNPEFHNVRRQIHKTEHAIYKGTKLEQIREAEVADRLYLAVPWGEVRANELADSWGLLWVSEDLEVSCVQESDMRGCLDVNRCHLIQNIASAATDNVLMMNGIRRIGGEVRFVKPSRGHRQPVQPKLW